MDGIPTKAITIYHKTKEGFERYVKEASVRNTSIRNHNRNGTNSSENVIIRIFDIEEYNKSWLVNKDDVIVNMEVKDVIENEAFSTLKKKYGKENVFSVKEINEMIFEFYDLDDLPHIKLGCD